MPSACCQPVAHLQQHGQRVAACGGTAPGRGWCRCHAPCCCGGQGAEGCATAHHRPLLVVYEAAAGVYYCTPLQPTVLHCKGGWTSKGHLIGTGLCTCSALLSW